MQLKNLSSLFCILYHSLFECLVEVTQSIVSPPVWMRILLLPRASPALFWVLCISDFDSVLRRCRLKSSLYSKKDHCGDDAVVRNC